MRQVLTERLIWPSREAFRNEVLLETTDRYQIAVGEIAEYSHFYYTIVFKCVHVFGFRDFKANVAVFGEMDDTKVYKMMAAFPEKRDRDMSLEHAMALVRLLTSRG